jgi:hypothetical protein
MDTALHDYDPFQVVNGMTLLEPDELLWHVDKIERFHAQRGRTILLSHHQLFSGYATIGRPETKLPAQQAFNTNLLNSFRTSLEARKIAAWFWGHEHTLSIYQPYPPLDKGRCLGHGAIPVLASQQPYRPLAGLPNPPALVKDPNGRELQLSVDGDGVYDLGYVLIRLRSADGSAEVSYYQSSQPDQPLYTEVLS